MKKMTDVDFVGVAGSDNSLYGNFGGVTKQIRVSDLKAAVSPESAQEYWSYGVEFDTEVSSPDCTRIGAMGLHRQLPIHSAMRGCLLDDNGEVVEYLNANDWTGHDRSGAKGQVMVEIPKHYRRFETDGTKRRVYLSELPIPGFHEVPKMYVSAYQATVERSTSKLCSVVNTAADYRGGNNTSDWDGTYRSLLGRPASNISRTNFRTYARNRGAVGKNGCGWNCMTYDIQKTLYWLFVVEYATLNSQKAYNAALTTEGYRQGGLGAGVSNWGYDEWVNYNSRYPIVPCGHTDTLGNSSGYANYAALASDGTSTQKTSPVPRYRGVENPFGHIWQWTDGINVQVDSDNVHKVYVCSDPAKFSDSGYTGYTHVGNEVASNGYVKEVIFGEWGDIMPSAVGGSDSSYFCDYHYQNEGAGLRGVYFGGPATYGSRGGFVCAYSVDSPSNSDASIGSRLCFIPE